MNETPNAPAPDLTCSHCGRRMDECAFCDEGDCGSAVCYECVTVELGENLAQPHTHGG